MQDHPVEGEALGLQLQLRPDAPTGDVDAEARQIVLDAAKDAVPHLSNFGWVGPHCQLLRTPGSEC